MFQHTAKDLHPNVHRIGFSEKIWRGLKRAAKAGMRVRPGTWQEVEPFLMQARREMAIAPDNVILEIMARNPKAMQVACPQGNADAAKGLVAVLPLNIKGTEAVLDGSFSGLSPNPDWICLPNEKPESVYYWLVYMPGSFGRLLGTVAGAIEPFLDDPVPIFSRATNPHSAHLQDNCGFLPARQFYPDCPEGLLVVFPQRSIPQVARPTAEVRIARSVEDIFKVFAVRSATYMAEQYCTYEEEFDGNDFCSTQFLGLIDGDAAGCVRLRFFNGFAKLERLAVRQEYRNSRLAYQLARAAMEHCRKKGYTKVYGHSRLDLVRFWKVFGFQPIADQPEFSFANVKYVEILAELEADPDAIQLGADPMVMIRPEGAWDRPGPFDLGVSDADPRKRALLAQKTRTVGRQLITA